MSRSLFAVALVCLVAVVSAQTPATTTITRSFYAEPTCTGTPFQPTTFTAGACRVDGTESEAYFAVANDFVYFVEYGNQNCTADAITSITQFPVGCAKVNAGLSYTVTLGTSVPALPFGTFPPEGYAIATSFVNVTSSMAATTVCATGNGVVSFASAIRLGYCQLRKQSTGHTNPSSEAAYCSAGGEAIGTAEFADATCGAVRSATVSEANICRVENRGASRTVCPANAPTLPSDLPTQGFESYNDALCQSANPTVTLLSSNCFDGMTFTCGVSVNGTAGYATLASFSDADGKCTTPSQTTTRMVGTCVNGRKFQCAVPPQGGAASAISVSIVATFVAAIVALVAGRSL